MRLLTIWGLGGGGGDLAGTTFPRLLPLETVSRPGEALALVYPLAAGRKRCEWIEINRNIKTGECRQWGTETTVSALKIVLK